MRNTIKSDFNGNEILVLSDILIHLNYDVIWFFNKSYF